jgi:hypothetical protein
MAGRHSLATRARESPNDCRYGVSEGAAIPCTAHCLVRRMNVKSAVVSVKGVAQMGIKGQNLGTNR